MRICTIQSSQHGCANEDVMQSTLKTDESKFSKKGTEVTRAPNVATVTKCKPLGFPGLADVAEREKTSAQRRQRGKHGLVVDLSASNSIWPLKSTTL